MDIDKSKIVQSKQSVQGNLQAKTGEYIPALHAKTEDSVDLSTSTSKEKKKGLLKNLVGKIQGVVKKQENQDNRVATQSIEMVAPQNYSSISFKGNFTSNDVTQVFPEKPVTKEEFLKILEESEASDTSKLQLKGFLSENELSQEQYALLLKIIFYPQLWKGKKNRCHLNSFIHPIVSGEYTSEDYKAQLLFIDNLLSDTRLLDTTLLQYGKMSSLLRTKEDMKYSQSIIDSFFSNPNLYCDKTSLSNLERILGWHYSPLKKKVIEILLSNPNLFNNSSIQRSMPEIFLASSKPERANVVDKFFSDPKLYENKSLQEQIGLILANIGTVEKSVAQVNVMDKYLLEPKFYDNELISSSLSNFLLYKNPLVINELMVNPDNFVSLVKNVNTSKEKVFLHPELYVNGEYDSVDAMQKDINSFYDKNYANLIVAHKYIGNETVNNILRMRIDEATEYFDLISKFKLSELELLQKLCNAKDANGNLFNPAQKVQFINLINSYKNCGFNYTEIEKMILTDNVNLEVLNRNLFKKVMLEIGVSEEKLKLIPNEKLNLWDAKYMHLFSKEAMRTYENVFLDLINAANFEDFTNYIHDESNIYGQSNATTKNEFEKLGMNYDAWVTPSRDSVIHFLSKDKNQEQLLQVSEQIIEDIEALRKTPVKGIIDKRFKNFIKNAKFIIPQEISSNKSKLEVFTKNLIEQLDDVWKRAQSNLNNPNKEISARNTLTVLDHLKQRVKDIGTVETSSNSTKTIDITIKMWDRIPQKDIFQGNYSTCCIGMNEANGSAMPHYLLNTTFNMIELVDNKTGSVIGNALCYMAVDENGSPMFIVDNIEIANSRKPSDAVGKEIRNSIVEYASKVVKEVTGKDDIPIYMGGSYNDVPIDDLPKEKGSVKLLGQVDCDDIYMDLFGGWGNPAEIKNNVELLKLR